MLGPEEIRERISEARTPSSENKTTYGKEQAYKLSEIYRALLVYIPVDLGEYEISRQSERPIVASTSDNIFSNIIHFVKPSPTPSFAMKVMYKLIDEGVVKRVAGLVKKVDHYTGKPKLSRVYLYVQSSCEVPAWWVVPLNAKGSLKTLPYDNPETVGTKSYFRNIVKLLPEMPPFASSVDKYNTPGTSRCIARQLGLDPTKTNLNKIVSVLNKHVVNGDIGKVVKRSSSPEVGNNNINLYYKI